MIRDQISYRFGIKVKTHGQANEHLVIIKSTVQNFCKVKALLIETRIIDSGSVLVIQLLRYKNYSFSLFF